MSCMKETWQVSQISGDYGDMRIWIEEVPESLITLVNNNLSCLKEQKLMITILLKKRK